MMMSNQIGRGKKQEKADGKQVKRRWNKKEEEEAVVVHTINPCNECKNREDQT